MGRGAGKSKGTTAPSGAGLSLAAATIDDQLASSLDVNAEQELAMLLAVPSREGTSEKPFSCRMLTEARQLQKALFTYVGGTERDVATETVEEQTRSLCRFLKAYYNAITAAEWTAHSMGDDLMIDAGFVAPFVTPGAEGPEMGVPSVIYEDTVCDNVDELTRATCAAIFSCLVYQNVPQQDAESSPDQVASVFLSLALQSVRTPEQQAAFDTELKDIDLKVEGVQPLTAAEITWLLLHFRASLSCMTAQVLQVLGKGDEQKVNMVKALQDYSNMIKLCPDNPHGYLKFAELALNLNQIKHAGIILKRGLRACGEGGAELHSWRMRYMLAVCRVLGSPRDVDPTTGVAGEEVEWNMQEIEELQKAADADLAAAEAWLPTHLRYGTTGVDNMTCRYKALLNDKLLDSARQTHGEMVEAHKPLPPIQALITTQLPTALPQGALVASS